jgi:hypothetical protein
MASFAKLNSENIVEIVISVHNNELLDSNGNESEEKGILFLKSLYGQNTNWKQTSYNTKYGKHYNTDNILSTNQNKALRKNHAAIGYSYDPQRDAFIPQKLFKGWVLNEETCHWKPPFSQPETDYQNRKFNGFPIPDHYEWDNETENWKLSDNYIK